MKKLSYGDLTPEFLKVLSKLKSPAEIINACKEKKLEVSEKGAGKLLEQFQKAEILRSENLEKVAGGGTGYSGTRNISQSIAKRAAACADDCYWDDDCWEDWPNIYCPSFCLNDEDS